MILYDLTLINFDYTVDEALKFSNKPIYLQCDYCNKIYTVISNNFKKSLNKEITKQACWNCRHLKRHEICFLKWGVKTSAEHHSKYTVDRNYFQSIDTEEKAYWLGFLTADGCLTQQHHVFLTLGEIDYNHLLKYKNSIKSDAKITYIKAKLPKMPNPEWSINIYDKHFGSNLLQYGITPNKSLTLTPYLNTIPKKLLSHYWRGVFDGDGSLFFAGNKWTMNLVGSFEVTTQFSNFIHMCGHRSLKPRKTKNIYTISYSGNPNAKAVANILYSNSNIYLDRKYEKAQIVMDLPILRKRLIHPKDS